MSVIVCGVGMARFVGLTETLSKHAGVWRGSK
jgi:hypothetical protein